MKRIAVVTDSTANLPVDLLEKYEIDVIPMNVHWGSETYQDGVTIDAETFYRWLKERDDYPQTSQPSAGEFMDFFRQVAARHATDTIVGIFVSAELSGTLTSAYLAQQALPELKLEIVDSRSFSMGLGFQVMAATQAVLDGFPLETVVQRVHDVRDRTQVIAAVETLEYLHRGGRIGGAARLLGTMLNLKPVLHIQNGRVEPLDKVRSRRKSLDRVIAIAEERLAGARPAALAVIHTGELEEVDLMLNLASERLKPERLYTSIFPPVVGTHSGPGTVGIAYYTKNGLDW